MKIRQFNGILGTTANDLGEKRGGNLCEQF